MYKIKKQLRYYIFFLLICSPNVIALSIEEYIDTLIKNHPHFIKVELNKKSKILDAEAKGSANAFVLRNSLSKNEADKINFNFSASKLMDNSATISLTHNWQNSTNSIAPNNNNNLEYSIPLIQNINGINDSVDFDIAKIELLIQDLKDIDANEGFIATQIKKLMDLEFAKQSKQIQEKQLNLTKQSLALANNKYDKGLIGISDILTISERKLNQEKQFIQTKYELDLLKLELAEQINVAPEAIDIEIDLYKKQIIEYEDINNILPNLRSIKQLDLEKSKLKRQLKTLENRLLPYVVAKIGNNFSSTADKYLNSFSDMDSNWYVSIDALYELGGKKSTLDLDNFKNSITILDINKIEQEMHIKQQIKSFQDRIDYLYKIKIFSFSQKNISADKLLTEKNKYDKALSQKELVIAAEQALYAIKLTYAQDALNYQKMIIDYLSFIDKLI